MKFIDDQKFKIDKRSLRDFFNNSEQLKKYLRAKAMNHKSYKQYMTEDKAQNCIKDTAIFLTRGNNWNDQDDESRVNGDKNKVRFVACFSYMTNENVAMWMLYGGINNTGTMLNLDGCDFRKTINETKKLQIGKFGAIGFQAERTIDENEYTCDLTDILYVAHNENKADTIKRSDERFPLEDDLKNNTFDCRTFHLDNQQFTYNQKAYGWNYENECRLVITVELTDENRNFYSDKDLAIKLPIVFKDEKSTIHDYIVLAPNYVGNLQNQGYKTSDINGLSWDLCKNCKVKKS